MDTPLIPCLKPVAGTDGESRVRKLRMIGKLSRPLLLLLLAASLVDTAGADGNATRPTQAPEMALKTATDQLCGLIKDHRAEYKASSGNFYSAIGQVVVPHFDMPEIAALVLAANYRSATPEQRTRFAKAFEDMLVRTYASAMLDNCNPAGIHWMPPRLPANATDAAVNASLARDNGEAFIIGFRVHLVDGEWKIYDVAVENVSLVLNFRTQINSEIRRSSLDGVIAQMERGRL